MLRLQDVKETVKAKCVAENRGGRQETDFEVFVAGFSSIIIYTWSPNIATNEPAVPFSWIHTILT